MHPALELLLILAIVAVLAHRAKGTVSQLGLPPGAATALLGAAVKFS